MIDYIIWDDKNKLFFNEDTDLCKIYEDTGDVEYEDEEYFSSDASFLYPKKCRGQFSKYYDVGKTDINDKKIYADCSIVEFDLNTANSYEVGEMIKFTAYFEYHEDELRYELIILDYDKKKHDSIFTVLSYDMDTMSNLKIIDTIQENKLGLIKC